MLVRILALGVLCLAVLPARADEAQIRKMIESKLDGAQIESVQPVPVLGLYEVVIRSRDGPRIVYTDAQATSIILGSIYDVRHDRNLTEERMNKLLAISFDSLPLQDAVKIRRGSGRRVLAMFSDPYCPACQQFEKELARVDDITIYVFMYPVIHPELAEQSKAIWCSPDRSKAWLDLALRGKRPSANADCANPLERNLVLGHRLGVNSTPTLFLANGERLRGGLSSPQLATTLDDVYRDMKAAQAPK
ncbi:MAG: DsbC family protein [Burkholderiales bacterium]